MLHVGKSLVRLIAPAEAWACSLTWAFRAAFRAAFYHLPGTFPSPSPPVRSGHIGNALSERQLSIDDETGSDRIIIRYNAVSNNINAYLFASSVQGGEFNYVSSDITQFSKIAFKWKANDFALWVDGVERATDTSGNTFSAGTLKDLSFDFNGNFDFYGKVKGLAVYNEALSESQLMQLTGVTASSIYNNFVTRTASFTVEALNEVKKVIDNL